MVKKRRKKEKDKKKARKKAPEILGDLFRVKIG